MPVLNPLDFCKDLGHVNTYKSVPNSSLGSSLIQQLVDIGFKCHCMIEFGSEFMEL